MRTDNLEPHNTELIQPISLCSDICFDPDEITLEGKYSDELTAFRARRAWTEIFELHFLLEPNQDFQLLVNNQHESDDFALKCQFQTACGRYAFWRLTNNQAPEAQYLIETAHIPHGESFHQHFLQAPDIRQTEDGPLQLGRFGLPPRVNTNWFDWFKDVLRRITDSI